MTGMFGDMDLDDATQTIPRGTYRIKLDSIVDKEASEQEYGKPLRKFMIFNFVLDDPNSAEAEDFNGEQIQGLFMNYFPDMTPEAFKEMDAKDKSSFRRGVKLYIALGRAFGADDDAIKSASINFEDYTNQHVIAEIFINRNGEMQIQQDKIVNADTVEL